MRGLPYYAEPEYHEYLLSRERRELFPRNEILSQIDWKNVMDLLDFGMGNGFFLQSFYKFISPETKIWGAECQEELIDYTLRIKVRENLSNFIPFFIDRTEHPLLPDWIPRMDMIFASCVMSTFADPALAIRGVCRNLKEHGKLVIIDWSKREAPSGPSMLQKISFDRMKYFVEDAGMQIIKKLKTGEFIYAFEAVFDPNKEREYPPHLDID
jgi:SAM-dependent methyltransferase